MMARKKGKKSRMRDFDPYDDFSEDIHGEDLFGDELDEDELVRDYFSTEWGSDDASPGRHGSGRKTFRRSRYTDHSKFEDWAE